MTEPQSRLVVLHVLGELRPSGMERMLVSAQQEFSGLGIDGIVLGQGIDHPYGGALRDAGYKTLTSRNSMASRYLAMRRAVVEDGATVIHIHTEGQYLPTAIAARLALRGNGGVVRTIHNVFSASGRWLISRRLQARIADLLMLEVIVPSVDVEQNENSLRRKTRVIFNWVDERFFALRNERNAQLARSDGPPTALIVGNCSPVKNHELAIGAARRAGHQLIHVGDESHATEAEKALLSEMAQDGTLTGRGVRSPDDSLLRADYFAMPSRNEGMPVALAEALVVGLPVLISNAPGLRWASHLDGVTALEIDEASWDLSLSDWSLLARNPNQVKIDFSPARGAAAYAEIYKSGKPRRRRQPRGAQA